MVRHLKDMGLRPSLRRAASGAGPAVTENGNLTLDVALAAPLADAAEARRLAAVLRAIPGVVDHGLFLGTADQVVVGHAAGRVEVLARRGEGA